MNNQTIKEIQELLTSSLETEEKLSEKLLTDGDKELRKPIKMKYDFLMVSTFEVYEEYKSFCKEIDSLQLILKTNLPSINGKRKIIKKYNNALAKLDSKTIDSFKSLISNNSSMFGFRPEELDRRFENTVENYQKIITPLTITLSDDLINNNVFFLKLKMIKFGAMKRQNYFMNRFSELLYGTSVCGFDVRFPIFQSKNNCVRKGEYIEGEIFIGTHSDNYIINKPKIIVNQDTLILEEGRSVTYKILAESEGDFKLNMKCELIHDLIGIKNTGESVYHYSVD